MFYRTAGVFGCVGIILTINLTSCGTNTSSTLSLPTSSLAPSPSTFATATAPLNTPEQTATKLVAALHKQDVVTVEELVDETMPMRDIEIGTQLRLWKDYSAHTQVLYKGIAGKLRDFDILTVEQNGETTIVPVLLHYSIGTATYTISMKQTADGYKVVAWKWRAENPAPTVTPYALQADQTADGAVSFHVVDDLERPIEGVVFNVRNDETKVITRLVTNDQGKAYAEGFRDTAHITIMSATDNQGHDIPIEKDTYSGGMQFRMLPDRPLRVPFRLQDTLLLLMPYDEFTITPTPNSLVPEATTDPIVDGSAATPFPLSAEDKKQALLDYVSQQGRVVAAEDVFVQDDFARVVATTSSGETSIVFYQWVGEQWQFLAAGSAFDPESLKKLGIPEALWP